MPLVLEHKKTGKRKVFATRDEAIKFIKELNPNIPDKVINTWTVADIVNEYITSWFIVIY